MITLLNAKNPATGELVAQYPAAQYQINPEQHVYCVPAIDEYGPIQEVDPIPGHKIEYIGLLSEWGFFIQNTIVNSLNLDGWDFGKYPDLHVILITKEEQK